MEHSNFLDALGDVHGGQLIEEADRHLRQVIAAVRERGGTSVLTLKIKVASVAENRVDVSGQVTAKVPPASYPPSIFFTDQDNSISRRDPRQHEMKFQDNE